MRTQFEATGGLAAFTAGYLECALWASMDDAGEPLDGSYTINDVAPEAAKEMAADCEDFVTSNAHELADWNAAQAGHDFWLTRNRHGAGFWDRGRGANGDTLTAAAHSYGGWDLYVGDDGMIYGA